MFVFGNDTGSRGCFAAFNIHTALGSGAYLRLPDGEEMPTTSYSDPMIVTGLSFGQKEKYHLVQCFRDVVHTYAFGHDPTSSMISVQYTGFMISSDGTTWSNVFDRFLTNYRANRLSRNQDYSEVFIGQKLLKGFLVGMSSSTSDPHHNLQSFTMDLLAVEVHGI